jgi:hypothetical protein
MAAFLCHQENLRGLDGPTLVHVPSRLQRGLVASVNVIRSTW